MPERWPPVYDADELKAHISELRNRNDVAKFFYETAPFGDGPTQGDVVLLDSEIPLLNAQGEPEAEERDGDAWLLLGNTCDLARPTKDYTWTQLVPIVDLTDTVTNEGQTSAIRRYETSRTFYLPPWSNGQNERLLVADLTRPVHIHKDALASDAVSIVASMKYATWVLLNACLVRFLARDDGRYD